MSEYVDFHYMPLEGKITGKQVLQQTEDAINDLGNKVYNLDIDEERIDEAIEKSEEAVSTANSALAAVTTGRSVWFNNVAEMVATDIEAGVTAETKGYYVANDGGNALYLIRQEKSGDVVDGGSLIALDNGNMAELVTDGTVNVKQFGAIGNGTDDDTTVFQNTSSYAQAKGFVPFVGVATYKITGSVTGTFNSFGEVTITGGGSVDIINLQEVVSDVSDIRDEVVDETASAKAYSESASTSATNASNSASSASTTATQLMDYLATKETLTAPAVDPTLTISGAAADAKVTGDFITNLNEINFEATQSIPAVTSWANFIITSPNGSYQAKTGNTMTSFAVTAGEYVYIESAPIEAGFPCGGFYSANAANFAYLVELIKKPGFYKVPTGTTHLILSYETANGCVAKNEITIMEITEEIKDNVSLIENIISANTSELGFERDADILAGNCIISGVAYRIKFPKPRLIDKIVLSLKSSVENQAVTVELADSNLKTANVYRTTNLTIGTVQADYEVPLGFSAEANKDYFVKITTDNEASTIGFAFTSSNGNSQVILGDGFFIRGVNNKNITTASAQIRYLGKIYLAPAVKKERTRLILAESDGDYTSLSDALSYCAQHTESDFDIIVKPGTYAENNLYYNAGNVNIIGENREKCIFETDGTLTPSVSIANRHFLMCHCYMEISNVSIVVNDVKYCLHQDSGSNAYLICKNVHFVFAGTNSAYYFCVGIGMHSKEHNEFYNCIFENRIVTSSNIKSCGVFCHNWNNQTDPAVLILEDCDFINTGIADISELGSTQPDVVRIKNCHTDANIGIILTLTGGYYTEGGAVVTDPLLIPYCIDVDIINTDCPIEIAYDTRPEWDNIYNVFYQIKNVSNAKIYCGEAVKLDTSQFNYRYNSCIRADTGCYGVAVTDIEQGEFGNIAKKGQIVKVKCTAGTYVYGNSLSVSNGIFANGNEADAVCMESVVLNDSGFVLAKIN